jgi:hypothetical protein
MIIKIVVRLVESLYSTTTRSTHKPAIMKWKPYNNFENLASQTTIKAPVLKSTFYHKELSGTRVPGYVSRVAGKARKAYPQT